MKLREWFGSAMIEIGRFSPDDLEAKVVKANVAFTLVNDKGGISISTHEYKAKHEEWPHIRQIVATEDMARIINNRVDNDTIKSR